MNSEKVTREMLNAFSEYHQAHVELVKTWQKFVFLSPRWWVGLSLGLLPWFVWWKFHNKNYTGDLLRAGFLMAILSLILDSVGVQLGLWVYTYDVFPFIPGYFPWDLSLLPITIMFLIEIKPHWSPFLKALLFGVIASFIGEPLAEFSKLYEPLKWKHYYSFPIHMLLFLLLNKVAKSPIFNSKM